jgi:hypothetical protein
MFPVWSVLQLYNKIHKNNHGSEWQSSVFVVVEEETVWQKHMKKANWNQEYRRI